MINPPVVTQPVQALDAETKSSADIQDGGKAVLIDLIVSDVHRNEQVNIAALSKGYQTILCCKLAYGKYYALWPMKSDSYKYAYSEEGIKWQDQIHNQYGDRLDGFHMVFVAKVWASCNLVQNTVKFWQDMQSAGLFKYWDTEGGPYKWYSETVSPEVQMLRVYRVDCDLKPHIKPNAGYRNAPIWIGGSVPCKGTPVLTDQAMKEQFVKFSQICLEHGSHALLRS